MHTLVAMAANVNLYLYQCEKEKWTNVRGTFFGWKRRRTTSVNNFSGA